MKKVIILLMCLLLAQIVRSQSWKANADSLVVNRLFADKISQIDIFAFPELLTSTDSITLYDGTVVHIPYMNCYGYFIDLQPFANWSHSCKYCFVDASLRHHWSS